MIDVVTERLQFTCRDKSKRVLVLHGPAGDNRGGIVLAHCFAFSDSRYTLTRMSRGLADAGYAVLRWDFTGLGDAPDVAQPTASADQDLARAAALLTQRGCRDVAFIGHSVAGLGVLLATETARAVASVVLVGTPATRPSAQRMFDASPWHSFPVSTELLDDYARYDSEHAIANLGKPLLVVHGLDDETVPIEDGEKLFGAATQPKAFIPLVGADHLLTAPAAGEQLLRVTMDWLHRTRT